MDLRGPFNSGEPWELPEALVRELWKIARDGEWSDWNERWKAHCCPGCGGPKSLKVHELGCSVAEALQLLELLYPEVTRPLPLNPIEDAEADKLLGGLIDGIQGKKDDPDDLPNLKPFWKS